ncbi:MAG: helix-turn-helix transcriptional regulator [Hyphomicrobiaceae bacterium]
MRRIDRLLHTIQILRRNRFPVTADRIADELQISVRTVYRDISGLIGDGVPIRGEAGIGYVLGDGFDLPPLMFNADEVEAMLVGLKWVEARADPSLGHAARDVVAKIAAVLPQHLKPVLLEGGVDAPRMRPGPPAEQIDVAQLRAAVRERRKVSIAYADVNGQTTTRTIWPLALAYFEMSRIIVAWCELRGDYRHFRTDRMQRAEVQSNRYPGSRAKLLADWRAQEAARASAAKAAA